MGPPCGPPIEFRFRLPKKVAAPPRIPNVGRRGRRPLQHMGKLICNSVGRRGRRPVRRCGVAFQEFDTRAGRVSGPYRTFCVIIKFPYVRREGFGRGTVRVPLLIQSPSAARRRGRLSRRPAVIRNDFPISFRFPQRTIHPYGPDTSSRNRLNLASPRGGNAQAHGSLLLSPSGNGPLGPPMRPANRIPVYLI